MTNKAINNKKPEAIIHLLSDARGIYIPRDFCDIVDLQKLGLSENDLNDLDSPENEFYWDTWHNVLDKAKYIDGHGNEYRLHHDGDLWLICFELMTYEEKINFGFDVED